MEPRVDDGRPRRPLQSPNREREERVEAAAPPHLFPSRSTAILRSRPVGAAADGYSSAIFGQDDAFDFMLADSHGEAQVSYFLVGGRSFETTCHSSSLGKGVLLPYQEPPMRITRNTGRRRLPPRGAGARWVPEVFLASRISKASSVNSASRSQEHLLHRLCRLSVQG